ncbi:MAG: hypothetical protein E7488_07690 [Ruminococcaceae bacterium]|nr:hypothetical protein [Oscillospiraceae bacterium]
MSKRSIIIKNSPIGIEQADTIARAVFEDIVLSWNNEDERRQVQSFMERYTQTQIEINKSV